MLFIYRLLFFLHCAKSNCTFCIQTFCVYSHTHSWNLFHVICRYSYSAVSSSRNACLNMPHTLTHSIHIVRLLLLRRWLWLGLAGRISLPACLMMASIDPTVREKCRKEKGARAAGTQGGWHWRESNKYSWVFLSIRLEQKQTLMKIPCALP